MNRSLALVAAVVMLFLAGCSGAATPESDGQPSENVGPGDGGEPSEPIENPGSIRGVVVDGESLPIPGARVAISGTNIERESAVDGSFVFSKVAPGTHQLAAAKVGFEAGVLNGVQVQGGQETKVTITMEVLAKAVPFVQTWDQAGASNGEHGVWAAGTQVKGYGGTVYTIETEGRTDALVGAMAELQVEQQSVSPISKNISFGVTSHYQNVSSPYFWCGAEGDSPVRCIVPQTKMDVSYDGGSDVCRPEGCKLQFLIFGQRHQPSGDTVTVTLSISASWHAWISMAYYQPFEVGYSALPPEE